MDYAIEEPELVLEVPEAVDVVKDDDAIETVSKIVEKAAAKPRSPQTEALHKTIAVRTERFVNDISTIDPNSPEFQQKIDMLSAYGRKEIAEVASVASGLLNRPIDRNGATSKKVSDSLLELRREVADLDPKRADLTGAKKILKWMPGFVANPMERYVAKTQSAQEQINAIVDNLISGKEELQKDVVSIDQERYSLYDTMQKLWEYRNATEAMDAAIVAEIEKAKAEGDEEKAAALNNEALFAVRQRRVDIETQIAVAVQSYLSLNVARKTNTELIKGVDRAKDTTVSALRSAILLTQVVDQQGKVLDSVNALNSTTESLIVSSSEVMKTQGVDIMKQASSSMISIDAVSKAIQNTVETYDKIGAFQAEASDKMLETIKNTRAQLDRMEQQMTAVGAPKEENYLAIED